MYKSGKRWVFAAITLMVLSVGLFAGNDTVKADSSNTVNIDRNVKPENKESSIPTTLAIQNTNENYTAGVTNDTPVATRITADRVLLNVHLQNDSAGSTATNEILDEMNPVLVASDSKIVPISRPRPYSFEFDNVPEGKYSIQFNIPKGYQFSGGLTGDMGPYVNSGEIVQIKGGIVVNNIYTRFTPIMSESWADTNNDYLNHPVAQDQTPKEGSSRTDINNHPVALHFNSHELTRHSASQRRLPQTGSASSIDILMAGFITLTSTLGIALGFKKRNKHEKI